MRSFTKIQQNTSKINAYKITYRMIQNEKTNTKNNN